MKPKSCAACSINCREIVTFTRQACKNCQARESGKSRLFLAESFCYCLARVAITHRVMENHHTERDVTTQGTEEDSAHAQGSALGQCCARRGDDLVGRHSCSPGGGLNSRRVRPGSRAHAHFVRRSAVDAFPAPVSAADARLCRPTHARQLGGCARAAAAHAGQRGHGRRRAQPTGGAAADHSPAIAGDRPAQTRRSGDVAFAGGARHSSAESRRRKRRLECDS